MTDSLKQRRMIDAAALGACALVAAVFFFAGVRPVLTQMRQRKAQRQALWQQHQKSDELGKKLAKMQRTLAEAQHELAGQHVRLAAIGALNERVAQLSTLASRMGLAIEEVRPGAAQDGRHYRTVPLHVAGHGSFIAASRFLHALHHSLPDVSLVGMALQSTPGAKAESAHFALDLNWYALP